MLTDRAVNNVIIAGLALVAILSIRTCSVMDKAFVPKFEPIVFQTPNQPTEEKPMITTWCYYISEGVKAKHTVETSQHQGETIDEWIARHAAIVAAAKLEFVPVSCD